MTTTTLPKPVSGLKAKAKANPQLVVGGAAVAIVVAVALMSKKTPPVAGTDTAAATAAGGQLTPNQGGYYDSTANDVYQSLAGQLQNLQEQISGTGATASDPASATNPAPPLFQATPVIAPVSAAQPIITPFTFDHLTRASGTSTGPDGQAHGPGAIYGVTVTGATTWLNPAQYKAAGSPTFNASGHTAPTYGVHVKK